MEFLALFISGIAGIILHILTKLYDLVTLEPKLPGQTFQGRLAIVWGKFDGVKAFIYALMGIVIVGLISGFRVQVSPIFPVTFSTVLLAGYSIDSFLNNLKKEN